MRQKGDRFTAIVEVKKVKNELPTVIEINGRRFVFEPDNKRSDRK